MDKWKLCDEYDGMQDMKCVVTQTQKQLQCRKNVTMFER